MNVRTLLPALASLTPREEVILRSLYGIGQTAQSVESVAQALAWTTTRVQKVKLIALGKLSLRFDLSLRDIVEAAA